MIPAFRANFEKLTHEEVDIIWGEHCLWMKEPTHGLNMDGKEFWKYCVKNGIRTHDLLRPLKTRQKALLLRILRIASQSQGSDQ